MSDVRSVARRLQRGAIRTAMTLAPQRDSDGSRPKVLITSMPKSGTHLISAVLHEFPEVTKYPGNRIDPPPPWSWMPGGSESVTLGVGHPRSVDRIKLKRFLNSLNSGVFLTGHVPHSPELSADLAEAGFTIIAMVRDPRDVVVSKVRFANSLPDGRLDRERMKNETPEGQISLATEGYTIEGSGQAVHIGERLQKILAWQNDGALVVRFEDLVGERGGGTAEAQHRTITTIREHLGLPSNDEIARHAAERSFGKSPTFRSGRSTGWNDHLSPDQAQRIETLAQDAMRKLGYLP